MPEGDFWGHVLQIERHDLHRGDGNFKKLLDMLNDGWNICLSMPLFHEARVAVVLCKQLKEDQFIEEYYKELGLKYIGLRKYSGKIIDDIGNGEEIEITEDDVNMIGKIIKKSFVKGNIWEINKKISEALKFGSRGLKELYKSTTPPI